MSERHFVTIKDYYGQEIAVEVSFEVWMLFDQEHRAVERQRYERRKHLDDRELEDYIVAGQAVTEALEDFYLQREKLRAVYVVLRTCTPVQRERFYLNRVCGYSFAEIARMQDCHRSSVMRSVDYVVRKIKKFIRQGCNNIPFSLL